MLCERSNPAVSIGGMRASCRLRQLRCWVAPGRDSSSSASSVRRVPSLRSSVSLRLGHTRPQFLHTSAGASPARSVPGVWEAALRIRCGLLAQTKSGFSGLRLRRWVGAWPHWRPCALYCYSGKWAVPAQAGEAVYLPFARGLLHSAVKPLAGLANAPFRSPLAPTRQTASPASLRCAPAPWSLADSLPAPTLPTLPSCRQRDCQQPRLTG